MPTATALTAALNFAAPYWHDRLNVCYTQQYLSDPDRCMQTSAAIHRHVCLKKAAVLRQPPPPESQLGVQPAPLVQGYHTTTVPMMLGCKVDFQDREYPHAQPLNLSDAAVQALEPIADFSNNPVMQDLEQQAAWLKAKHGRARIKINMQSVVNVAFKLRGDQLMFDFFENPALAHQLIDYVHQSWVNARAWIDGVNRKNGMPDDTPVRCIDNCNVALLSPKIYREFFLPYDQKTATIWGQAKLGIHHCGGNMDQFATDYAAVGPGVYYDIGFGSDVRQCIEILRSADRQQFWSVRFGPAYLRAAQPNDIIAKLDALAHAGANSITSVGTDPDTPAENLRAFWQWQSPSLT